MRIKKIAQSIGVIGKVLNAKSTSQVNTYSCDYINNGIGELIVGQVKSKNLLYTPYTETNKLTATATRDDWYDVTDYYVYLEQGKTYTFSAETDATWGGVAGTDTVECFLLKDRGFDYLHGVINGDTFIPQASGYYYFRYDINKNGKTHSFWNIQIEEGSTVTEYYSHQNLNGSKIYSTNEIIIILSKRNNRYQ